jgi:hypothetical protein
MEWVDRLWDHLLEEAQLYHLQEWVAEEDQIYLRWQDHGPVET